MTKNSGVPRYRRIARSKGQYRSGFEKTTADYLRSKKIKFKYEKSTFDYLVQGKNLIVCPNCGPLKAQIVRKYKPDFEIEKNSVFIECKGRFLAKDRSKMIAVKKQHPLLDIRLLFMRDNVIKESSEQLTYSQWAQRHGFKYAIKTVPDAWLKPRRVVLKELEVDYRKVLGDD